MSAYLNILSSDFIRKKELFGILDQSVKKINAKISKRQSMYEDGTIEVGVRRNNYGFIITLDSKSLYDSIEDDYKNFDFYRDLETKYGSIITIIEGGLEDGVLLNDLLKAVFEDHPDFLFFNDEVNGDPIVFNAQQVISAVNNAPLNPINASNWMWKPPVEEDSI